MRSRFSFVCVSLNGLQEATCRENGVAVKLSAASRGHHSPVPILLGHLPTNGVDQDPPNRFGAFKHGADGRKIGGDLLFLGFKIHHEIETVIESQALDSDLLLVIKEKLRTVALDGEKMHLIYGASRL